MKKVRSLLNHDLDLSLSRSTILQWHFLVILGMLVFDSPIPHNGFLGTC